MITGRLRIHVWRLLMNFVLNPCPMMEHVSDGFSLRYSIRIATERKKSLTGFSLCHIGTCNVWTVAETDRHLTANQEHGGESLLDPSRFGSGKKSLDQLAFKAL